jgi:soluble lytic murein transglycosylase-like protein
VLALLLSLFLYAGLAVMPVLQYVASQERACIFADEQGPSGELFTQTGQTMERELAPSDTVAEANRGSLTSQDFLDGLIIAEAAAHGIDPAVLRGVVRVESGYHCNWIGRDGEIGLCQILPSTAREMCRRVGIPYSQEMLYEPEVNIEIGAAYLRWCLEQEHGDYQEALERYNGFGRGYAAKVMEVER